MDSSLALLHSRVLAMAQAIRARRKALRLTQIELSRLAGCGPDFVYDVEFGKPTLRLDKLLELLAVLGLELVLAEGKESLRIVPSLVPSEPRARQSKHSSRPPPTSKKKPKQKRSR